MDAASMRRDPRLAGRVTRYHTWPRLREQSVGEHTWQLLRILDCVWPSMPVHVWRAVLWHDCGEIATGDVPYPVKQQNHTLQQEMDQLEHAALRRMHDDWLAGRTLVPIAGQERAIVKTCELIEMWEWGLEEARMGNTFGTVVASRCYNAAAEMYRTIGDSDIESKIVSYMQRRLEEWT